MKQLFGEYLVEKHIISEEQLLEVLMEQISGMPSLPEVIHNNRLLSTTQLVNTLAYQARHQCEFRAALKKLGYWEKKLERDIERRFRLVRLPIGQILVRKGWVDFDTMNSALDNYLKGNFSERTQSPAHKEPVVPHAVDVNPAAENVDELLIESYHDLLERVTLEGINEQLEGLKVAPDQEKLNAVKMELHRIHGAARFIGANVSESFVAVLEESLQRLPADTASSEWQEHCDLISKGMEIIWELKTDLVATQSETAGFNRFDEIEQISNDVRQLVTCQLESLNGAEKNENEAEVTQKEGANILLIDDAKSVHRFVSNALAEEGYRIDSSLNGKEGVKAAKKNAYKLILLDWEMPELDGPGCVKKLKDAGVEIPIIMITSRSSVDDITQMLDAGVAEYLMKPFTKDILIEKITSVVSAEELKVDAA